MNSTRKPWPHRSPDVEDIEAHPKSADIGGTTSTERRKHERQTATQPVSVENRYGREICDLVDLSPTGARLRIATGAVPKVGEQLSMTLLDGTTITGRVSWLGQNNVGIALGSPIGDVEALLTFEDLGDAYYGAALRLQRKSQSP
ncbi:MAG TPA: PilZ domain-containing protein [Hyphomicrobium sp.]|nr:PilZ domain-containing protein [Hyphomicrobium sp.]